VQPGRVDFPATSVRKVRPVNRVLKDCQARWGRADSQATADQRGQQDRAPEW
jgi:hypothetical protein